MPIAPVEVVKPQDSGTGQGYLTDQQIRMLADLYYYYKDDELFKQAMKDSKRYGDGSDPNQQWIADNENRAYDRNPYDAERKVAQDESLRGKSGVVGGYTFPQKTPDIPIPEPHGDFGIQDTGPPSQNSWFDQAWEDLYGSGRAANPPGWTDQEKAQPGIRPSAARPSVDGVTPASYTHRPVLTPQQAAAFNTLMLIQGHNGDTVGRGQVIPHPAPAHETNPHPQANMPTSNGPARAEL